jgi:tRNA nucleotidyltransferase/poly(A) polymerase
MNSSNNFDVPFAALLQRICAVISDTTPVYLVGGAVRDILMGNSTHDLDFALPGNAIEAGRRVANQLGAAFFPLDIERDTGRVILSEPGEPRRVLDFSGLRGPDLPSDLRDRDFTINAIALDARRPDHLIDPLSGAADLRAKVLRACSPAALENDPVRILRSVRLAIALEFRLLPETVQLIRMGLPGLQFVSPERLRDEIFRILDGPNPAAALRMVDMLGILPYILPELSQLKGIDQSPPHIDDVWNHTLRVVEKLGDLLRLLGPEHDPEMAANWASGLISLRLGRYREQLARHIGHSINLDRSLHALLLLAALYHDAGKARTRQIDEAGRIHFYNHDHLSEHFVHARGEAFRLSNLEIERLETIVGGHMRPLLLANASEPPTRRAVYRFFRDTGAAGVDICLLSLADMMGTYGATLPQDIWIKQLDVVRILLEAWWEQPAKIVSPPALVNGHDLMNALNLRPGPQIGRLLEAIREAQAAEDLNSREQALEYAWTIISKEN